MVVIGRSVPNFLVLFFYYLKIRLGILIIKFKKTLDYESFKIRQSCVASIIALPLYPLFKLEC